jgi:hypothetical protein
MPSSSNCNWTWPGSTRGPQVDFALASDALVDLLHALGELVLREVAIALVDRLELAAVDDAQRQQL